MILEENLYYQFNIVPHTFCILFYVVMYYFSNKKNFKNLSLISHFIFEKNRSLIYSVTHKRVNQCFLNNNSNFRSLYKTSKSIEHTSLHSVCLGE